MLHAHFHTIKSILNLIVEYIIIMTVLYFHTIKSILNFTS